MTTYHYTVYAEALIIVAAKSEQEAIDKAKKKSTRTVELSNFIVSDVEE